MCPQSMSLQVVQREGKAWLSISLNGWKKTKGEYDVVTSVKDRKFGSQCFRMKFSRNTATLIHLHIVSDRFVTDEPSGCGVDSVTHET